MAELETDLRKIYDMDEDYNLRSWTVPSIGFKMSIGDKFLVDGVEQKLTKMDYAHDMLGIYAMYPILNEDFNTLVDFLRMMEEGKIIKID